MAKNKCVASVKVKNGGPMIKVNSRLYLIKHNAVSTYLEWRYSCTHCYYWC